jgi:penicillin-binding protein 2B
MMNQFKGAKVSYAIFAFVIFCLVCNIVYIGATGKHLLSGEEIESFAKSRGTTKDIMHAQRGEILSSDNEVIANNVKKYKLIAYTSNERAGYGDTPASVQDVQKTAQEVAPLINMDVAEMATKLQTAVDNTSWQIEFGNYGNNISSLTMDKINALGLPGLEFSEQASRNYPMGDFASYIVGYAQTQEENSVQSIVGKMGLELAYDESLAGSNGYRIYEVDANKNRLPNGILEEKKAVDGNDVHLTINASLQRDLDIQLASTAQSIDATIGASVIMEAKTGKILAISNYPSFNPNELESLISYQNFFFEQTYECGSVFKPFVYSNVIDDGRYVGTDTYLSGQYQVGSSTIHDVRPEGWGRISFDEGLARSSNTAIANLIEHYADQDSLIDDYYKLKFFTPSTIDSFSSPPGVAVFEKNPKLLENITTGFGQGSTVTPLQLLRAYSVFANDGKMVEPYFIDRIVNPSTEEIVYSGKPQYSEQIFSSDTIDQMNGLLTNNISADYAAARAFRLDDDIQMMGKTGTGQIPSGEGGYRTDLYSMSFVGLVPAEDPEIIVMSVFQCPDQVGTVTKMGNFIKTMVPSALATKASYTESIETTPDTNYVVDSFTNQSVNYVKSKLDAKQITSVIIGSGSSVVDQFPLAQTTINAGDRVFIKTEGTQITIPNMIGWSRKDVLTYASLSGISITFTGTTGQVTEQSVDESTIMNVGETFNVTLE